MKQNREQNKLAVTNVYDPVQFNLADAESPAPTNLGVYDHAAHPAVAETRTFKRQLAWGCMTMLHTLLWQRL